MWITYPADFEIWLGNKFNNRRTERGAMFPPFWKQDSHYISVEFSTVVNLTNAETINIWCEGKYNFMLDGKLQFGQPTEFDIPAGEHRLNFKVWNQLTPPALYVEGKTIKTDKSWLATYEDKIWIDENGVAHGSGIYVHASAWDCFNKPNKCPSSFKLSTKKMIVVGQETIGDGMLYDFGKETMGYPVFENLRGQGTLSVYYGESREEALDKERCETLDHFTITSNIKKFRVEDSKAYRFIYVETQSLEYDSVYMMYEYLHSDSEKHGCFECSDDELNKIWQVGAYTMDLTTREFFMDGIKRDRWTWSGDAIQSYLMNYYLRFDTETVKRTIRQLRGKDPVTAHVNTIMDYTFYWFKSIYDYYLYTGDADFIQEMYPRMKTLMDYCLSRTDKNGMMAGKEDDWIFVDWVDFPMHKRGILSFEQILFCKSLETMKMCANLLANIYNKVEHPQGSVTLEQYNADSTYYNRLFTKLRKLVDKTFWDNDRHAYLHSIEDGEMNTMVTKFPNMFALTYGYASDSQKKDIMQHVMLNPDIEAITTPYMRFYELEALCEQGLQNTVLSEMKAYWGGMLREGATSFWEKYIPSEKGTEHLQMYGRPYGKSLCHAWGASPIYLIGKYFLGVKPIKPGYEEWEARPVLGGLEWMQGEVLTPMGAISVKVDGKQITIKSPGGKGNLYFTSNNQPYISGEKLKHLSGNRYCLTIRTSRNIVVTIND